MYNTTKAYKREQEQALRERDFVYVNLGIINKVAQETAYVTSNVTDYSTPDNITKGIDVVGEYATLEDVYTKVNGSNSFLPRNSTYYSQSQGAVTPGFDGSITFRFRGHTSLDIKGFTIEFGGSTVPWQLVISNGTVSHTYSNIDMKFTCEDEFPSTEYIIINFTFLSGTNCRSRINSILFGIGMQFTNDQLKSTYRHNVVHHLSDALPLKQFDFTIDNLNGKFSSDNPNSFAEYLTEGQEVDFEYGIELFDELEQPYIYKIPGGHTYLKSWSSDAVQAKFTTVGKLDFMENEYYKGTLDTAGTRTAYDVAEAVFTDAGITKYKIDSYLASVPMRNPLPITTHKACLQMIANYCRSIMYEDRLGNICIGSSFVPQGNTVTATDYEIFSDLQGLLDYAETNNYATLEVGYTTVNETRKFLPRSHSSQIDNSGFTGVNGDSSITVEFSAQWDFFSVRIKFVDTLPAGIILTTYANNVVVDTYVVDEIEPETIVEEIFNDIDKIVISFTGSSSKRVHISGLKFDTTSKYTIRKMDMMDNPVSTGVEKVRNVDVNYYSYTIGPEVKELSSLEASVGNTIIKNANPASDYTLLWKDGTPEFDPSSYYRWGDEVIYQGKKYEANITISFWGATPFNPNYWTEVPTQGATITDSGAYFVAINITNIPVVDGKPLSLLIYGREMTVGYSTFTKNLHDLGTVKTLDNVLIQSKEYASTCADWVADYLDKDVDYSINYRGEPALDCDDRIYVESDYVNNNLCRITEEELSTSIGMNLNNQIKLRRMSYDPLT